MNFVHFVRKLGNYLILLGAVTLYPGHHAAGESLNVAVASNFTETMKLIQADFERIHGHTLQLSSGSSGAHFAQIMNGAPFDLLLSADSERPQALEEAGLITPGQRRIYAYGRLALWSKDNSLVSDINVLSNIDDSSKIAIANPRLAPYGLAAYEALVNFGVYDSVKDQLVMGENVGQAFQFVFSGNAAVGLIAYSQVLSAPVAGSYVLISDSAYKPIAQEMALLRPSPAAQALFDYIGSPAIASILQASGYYAPTEKRGD